MFFREKVAKFLSLLKTQGLVPAIGFAVFKLFPNAFRLLPLRDGASKGGVYDYQKMLSEVLDLDTKGEDGSTKLGTIRPKRYIWFVPRWANVWGGGHYTIFRFANRFQNIHGVENIIYLYDCSDRKVAEHLQKELRRTLPDCGLSVSASFDDLPETDVAIATTWQSAYFLRAFQKAHSKFYFMQDYESLFYAGGSNAMQANLSYTFGFKGITGGAWLKSIFESYGGKAENYVFSTDREIFFPGGESANRSIKKLFFYGRPSTERRAFELGIASLKKIKEKYPHIEVNIAGLDGLAAPPFACNLLGNLSLKETGELYRSCDVGLAFSGTNLSYLPVELMASGVPVITNSGPQSEWYCKDGLNALVAEPTPSAVLQKLEALIESQELRKKIIEGGLQTAAKTTWEAEIDKIQHYIQATK